MAWLKRENYGMGVGIFGTIVGKIISSLSHLDGTWWMLLVYAGSYALMGILIYQIELKIRIKGFLRWRKIVEELRTSNSEQKYYDVTDLLCKNILRFDWENKKN